MTDPIIILLGAFLLFLFLYNRKTPRQSNQSFQEDQTKKNSVLTSNHNDETAETFFDEQGKYRLERGVRNIPRKTYIKARLIGKYWGELDTKTTNDFTHAQFFRFHINEATLSDAIYSKSEIKLEGVSSIPREKLPNKLKTILRENNAEYEVELREISFADININRKLHQTEGFEVFGTIEADIAGYVLDFQQEVYYEKIYLTETPQLQQPRRGSGKPIIDERPKSPPLRKTSIPTGNTDFSGNYSRTEYYYSDYKTTYWGDWTYRNNEQGFFEGCFSTLLQLIAGIVILLVIIFLLPRLLTLVPILLIFLLFRFIPAGWLTWLFRLLGIAILIGFILSIIGLFKAPPRSFVPRPVQVDRPEEKRTVRTSVIDTVGNLPLRDTIIQHSRIWEDYDGNTYQGTISVKQSDFIQAQYYKANLSITSATTNAYDEVLFKLKENDRVRLNGVYTIFDSIRASRNLSDIQFAKMVVSFVQDIAYTIVVDKGCNPQLYDDRFIREFLSSSNARCDGFERFGINSPVEFMATLNGDCDSRTLLLYTIFAHYDFDVAVLSSEQYSHSILGVNLPIEGKSYNYRNQRYVLWETTTVIPPGILPTEISNLDYWRISLKSK